MACSNCFNGCSEITSDKCVKYTGPDIEALGISNGDTLLSVENNITTYLLTALDGTGIVPAIDPASLCALVSGYLPGVGTINLVDIIDAIFQSLCDLQTQVTANTSDLTTLNADYTVDCLSGVVASDDTHDILQATITKLCLTATAVSDLALDVATNYVAVADINNYISSYLTASGSGLMKSRMVPYTAVEYYGPLTNFDASGAGTGDWIDVYLCNGLNGTPDKRGRVGVGAIVGVGGGALDSQVDPATSTNPNYGLLTKSGNNAITLTTLQLPAHTHTASSIVTDPGHTHDITDMPIWGDSSTPNPYDSNAGEVHRDTKTTNSATTGITVATTIGSTGGGDPHSNIQPSLGCYYIIYLP